MLPKDATVTVRERLGVISNDRRYPALSAVYTDSCTKHKRGGDFLGCRNCGTYVYH